MPGVILRNVNGSLKIVSKDVILESNDSGSANPSSTDETFQEAVQNTVCHYTPGNTDNQNLQWVERAAVPLYKDSACSVKAGVVFFKDESIKINYDVSYQLVAEDAYFLIPDVSSTSISYSVTFNGNSANFGTGIYNLQLTSAYCSDSAIAAPSNKTLSVNVGDNLRTLKLPAAYGSFNNVVDGTVTYYWQKSDFSESADYGYSSLANNYAV